MFAHVDRLKGLELVGGTVYEWAKVRTFFVKARLRMGVGGMRAEQEDPSIQKKGKLRVMEKIESLKTSIFFFFSVPF